jgi:hypothetical protein
MDDLFGSSDDEDDEQRSVVGLVFVELSLRLRPTQTRVEVNTLIEEVSTEVILRRVVRVVGGEQGVQEELQARLKAAGWASSLHSRLEQGVEPGDVVIVLGDSDCSSVLLYNCTLPGGLVICCGPPTGQTFSDELWIVLEAKSDAGLISARRRSTLCNTQAAVYWGATEACDQLDGERSLLEDISLPLSAQERALRTLSDESRRRAAAVLDEHGVCVLPGLCPPSLVLQWGQAASDDMKLVVDRLSKKGIFLLDPGQAGQPRIENYREMSMREALRCDLRNGKKARALALAAQADTHLSISNHPAIADILTQVMNPPADPALVKGNWGRWNFEGPGPEAKPSPPTVGGVGALMSLPGCADQTLHADTPHTQVHVHLPGHYFNVFLPAVPDEAQGGPQGGAQGGLPDFRVGQTAFVLGSHRLSVSALVMTQEGGQQALSQRLVRPHLRPGDGLIFDCRVLHFGLANQTGGAAGAAAGGAGAGVWRPLLYINHTAPWFVDPKNWNMKEKLFDDEEDDKFE